MIAWRQTSTRLGIIVLACALLIGSMWGWHVLLSWLMLGAAALVRIDDSVWGALINKFLRALAGKALVPDSPAPQNKELAMPTIEQIEAVFKAAAEAGAAAFGTAFAANLEANLPSLIPPGYAAIAAPVVAAIKLLEPAAGKGLFSAFVAAISAAESNGAAAHAASLEQKAA